MTQELATQDPTIRYLCKGEEVALSVPFVKNYFCPSATSSEAFAFMRFCQYNGLNPFVRDAYLVKYDDKSPASIQVNYNAQIQRAYDEPRYQGFQAGIILQTAEGLERRKSTFHLPNERIVGGWCRVLLRDREPMEVEVSRHEYDKGRAQWKTMPAVMIQKCAISTAFRFAFPNLFRGMYDGAEVGQGEELPQDAVVIEANPTPRGVRDTGEMLPPAADPPPDPEWERQLAEDKARVAAQAVPSPPEGEGTGEDGQTDEAWEALGHYAEPRSEH